MEKSPAVRVAAARDMLDFLEKREAGSRERVWMRIPEPSRRFIEGLWRPSWIPLEHDHHLPDAIEAEFGAQQSREWFRLCIPEMVRKPLLEPLISGMLRVFGEKRRRLITVIPKGWGLVFRDFCEPCLGACDEDRIEVIFDCITPEVRPYPVYFNMWEGVCLGILDLTKSGGSLDYEIAPDRSCIRAEFSW